MLKLMNGSLTGGVNYKEVYMVTEDDQKNNITDDNQTTNMNKIPSLAETARKVARLENLELDDKQYIAYEIIACTFLLGLVHDGNDPTTTLYSGLVQTMECSSNRTIENIVRSLKARGGQRQSIMFLTGPAGSGNSTAVTVAQKFCHEFCVAVGVMWSDTKFLFTAYTEAAASLFGGVSISKATFLNKQKPLSLEDINEWQENKILVVDEVSFMNDSILKTLDTNLKVIKDRNKNFGWFSIIFARYFRQLPPVGSTEFELIYSSLSSRHW